MSREDGIPSFKELFEDWLQEEFGKDKIILKWPSGTRGGEDDSWAIVMRLPQYSTHNKEQKLLGFINPNEVFLNIADYNTPPGHFPEWIRQESRHIEDPSLFEWASKTIRNENKEWCKIAGINDYSTT